MSKIKILPENLANQIAAGEVIERPASVVKEFVENAIDAGACNISIQIEGDGSRLIRVVDDGCGMEQDDLLLSLERHATSKLDCSEQLSLLNTLGFRGEAIPSIASVSKLSITSRPSKAELGSRADIRFGTLMKVHEMGCPAGTVMEVKDLFGNMPARKKFLKSRQTELSHIDEVIKNYALVCPQIAFNYQVQGRTVVDLGSRENLERRVRQIICRADGDELVDLSFHEPGSEISVEGYLLTPGHETGGVSGLRIFVNGRAVKDRLIGHAVNEGLHNFLLKGKRPKGAIFVTLPPQDVDVNVHPTKQEIRFHRAQKVHDAVEKSIRQAMERYQKKLQHEIFGQPAERAVVLDGLLGKDVQVALKDEIVQGGGGENVDTSQTGEPQPLPYSSLAASKLKPDSVSLTASVSEEGDTVCQPSFSECSGGHLEENSEEHGRTGGQQTDKLPVGHGRVSYVGQIFNSYIVCEIDDGLVLVDQHAAQERLVYEELCRQYAESRIPSQTLMFPEVIELSAAERQIVEQHGDEIGRIGLDIKEFGGDSFIIQGIPAALSHLGPREVALGTLARFSDEGGLPRPVRLEHVLAGMACKAAIKAGRKLADEEVDSLLRQMGEAGIFSHCPHGRPVIKRFSQDDVKRWFLRT